MVLKCSLVIGFGGLVFRIEITDMDVFIRHANFGAPFAALRVNPSKSGFSQRSGLRLREPGWRLSCENMVEQALDFWRGGDVGVVEVGIVAMKTPGSGIA